MSKPARRPLTPAAIRAISTRRKAATAVATPANDNAKAAKPRRMSTALLDACVEAGGFDQNARFA